MYCGKIIKKLYKSLLRRLSFLNAKEIILNNCQTRFICFYSSFYHFDPLNIPIFLFFFNNTKCIAKSLMYVTYTRRQNH